jgi:GDP-4-dehydro-6-deoxy-D-mannose reductase
VFWNDAEPVPAGVVGVHYGDITDLDAIGRAVQAVRPELVFHLAGAASVGQSFGNPLATWHVNLDGTLVMLESLRQHAPTARCVTITSGEIHGRVPVESLPVGSDTPMIPHSPYGASKAAADLAALQYHVGYGLPVLRVRAFNHIGPGQDARFVVPAVARQIALGERDGAGSIEVHVGNVDARRDFSDVRDIVRAYRLVGERGDPGVAYLACSGRSVAVRELIEGLAALATVETTITSDATLRREGEQPDLYGSPDRLTADTGWVPEFPLDTSLKDTLDWWRTRVAQED